jgi:hypothetical protein
MRSFAILGLLALVWGFVQAPFAHVHSQDLDHTHKSAVSHFHVRGAHHGSGTSLAARTADDDAVDALWSISTPRANLVHTDFEAAARFIPAAELQPHVTILLPRYQSHDPPLLTSLSPRAPPA